MGVSRVDIMPKPPSWTKKDLKDLVSLSTRKDGVHLDWDALQARFPHRTIEGIHKKIYLLGLTKDRAWTSEEDKVLVEGWNELSSRTMDQKLPGRSKQSRYYRARVLGLYAGTPQGLVSVKSLALDPKWGYDYHATMKILKAGSVPIKSRNYASTLTRTRGVRYVDRDDAVDAAAAWEKHRMSVETVVQATDRIGMNPATMWRWLTLEGLIPPKQEGVKGGAGRRFSAHPEVYDRMNLKYRVRRLPSAPPKPKPKPPSHRLGKESPRMAAKRLLVRDFTIREWLTRDGLLPPPSQGTRCHFYAVPEVYDRLAEKYRTSRNAPKGPRHPPVAEERPAERSSTRMAGALPATMTPPPA